MASAEVPGELARASVLLQASRYEPFGLTVAEALAAGVPVVGTSEVGAIEGVDRSVAAEVAPGDAEALAAAVVAMLGELEREAGAIHAHGPRRGAAPVRAGDRLRADLGRA